MKKRTFKLFTATIVLIVAGILYYFLNKYTDFAIPCVFHLVTRLQCPGCGITRMLFSLLRLDFANAFYYNPAIMISLPLLIVLATAILIEYIKNGKMLNKKWSNICFYFLIAYFIIFAILRNLF